MNQTKKTIQIWDIPTRLFHWLLVIGIAGLWYTGKNSLMNYHFLIGYAVIGLMVFRLGWGLWGGDYSRFKALQLAPALALRYLKNGLKTDYPGHNPLGSWGVVLLLLSVSVQAVSGLFATDEVFYEGPLSQLVSLDISLLMTQIHLLNFDILLGLIGLHVFAVLVHTLIKKEDILHGMITGNRKISVHIPKPAHGSWEAVVMLVLIATMILTVIADLG